MKILTYAALIFVCNCVNIAYAGNKLSKSNVMTIGSEELALVLGDTPSPAEKRVGEIVAERVKERSGIILAASAEKAGVSLIIGTVASSDKIKSFAAGHSEIAELGQDGYFITVDPKKPELYVVGQSNSGVVAGVGRLMREMRYQQGEIVIPSLEISETPQMPNRGMYLWARKYYFNEPDKLEGYIEEFALWGCNAICFWFEMGMFNSFDDTSAQDPRAGYRNHQNSIPPQQWIKMYQRFYATARRMGMRTGLLMVANDGYRTSPPEMRIQPIIGTPNCYLCPSKPGSVEKMLAWQEKVFKALAPIDIFNIFPSDPGGCACEDCQPWPTRGFWKMVKPLGEMVHEISPKTEIWVDTWHMNHKLFGGKDWQGLVDLLDPKKKGPAWFTGFEVGIAPHHRYANMTAEDRQFFNKAGLPLTVFPDISMWGNHAGMLVKKDYWKTLQSELNDYDPRLMKGGWPYAERWNTDIAVVAFLSWFWDPGKTVDQVLDEYASFYFGPEVKTGRELLDLLDDSNQDPQRKQKIQACFAILNANIPVWVKNDWRWNEIMQSCSRFISVTAPQKALSDEEASKETVAASTELDAAHNAAKASDGILASQSSENFWASANHQDVGAWWQKNLGKTSAIKKVEVQFRGYRGKYRFVPKTITFQVSDDGIAWTTVVSKSSDVPANSSPYKSSMHSYELNAEGKYVRLLFEDGTDDEVAGYKLVELVEVKVN